MDVVQTYEGYCMRYHSKFAGISILSLMVFVENMCKSLDLDLQGVYMRFTGFCIQILVRNCLQIYLN